MPAYAPLRRERVSKPTEAPSSNDREQRLRGLQRSPSRRGAVLLGDEGAEAAANVAVQRLRGLRCSRLSDGGGLALFRGWAVQKTAGGAWAALADNRGRAVLCARGGSARSSG